MWNVGLEMGSLVMGVMIDKGTNRTDGLGEGSIAEIVR